METFHRRLSCFLPVFASMHDCAQLAQTTTNQSGHRSLGAFEFRRYLGQRQTSQVVQLNRLTLVAGELL